MSDDLSITPDMPKWMRLHRQAMRNIAAACVYTALEGIELLRIQRRVKPDGGWMAWLEANWPASHEAARCRIHLAEAIEFKLDDLQVLGIDGIDWFLALADREDEPDRDEIARAMGILKQIVPAGTVRQLFIEAGAIKPPPEKPEPKPARATEPRPPRPPVPMHVRVGRTWSKFPPEEKRAFVADHRGEIAVLLAEIEREPLALEATA